MSAAREVIRDILECADEERARACQRYFRTAPGEYGHGDVFVGVPVPRLRAIEKRHRQNLQWEDVEALLQDARHEMRLLAAIHLAERFQRADAAGRTRIFDFYLAHARHLNNWDIVDASAPHVVGAHLRDREKDVLFRLVRSPSLWERRIAVVATLGLIRAGHLDTTFELCERLLGDPHDLIHKACGWMLREAGKRDPGRLLAFLEIHAASMPRVELRYALEKFSPEVRARFLHRI